MADPLETAVRQFCTDGKKASVAEEQLQDALGGEDEAARERAASLLVQVVAQGSPAERARALRLLHTAWWPPSPGALAARAAEVVLELAPRFEAESSEWEEGAALLGNVVRSEPGLRQRLEAALGDASAQVRRIAATACGRIGFGAAAVVPRLGALLRDADEAVGDAALESLSALAPVAPLDGLPPLLEQLRSAEGMRRYLALVAVRAILEAHAQGETLPGEALEGVAEAVAPVLSDPEPAIRQQAVAVLGAAGGETARAAARFLEDPNPGVAATAAVALARVGPPPEQALAVLRQLLGARDPEQHHSAVSALEGAEAATLERLRPVLEGDGLAPEIREAVAALLSTGA